MYGRRAGSPVMHPSISAPALGREPPSLPERVWFRKPSSDSRSDEHSGASSPTTSMLLYMWGYDDTHALTRNGQLGGYPDLLTNTSRPLHRQRLFCDQSFFRRVTALLCGLAVVASFGAVLLSAGSRFRPDRAVGEPMENLTDPVLSLGEQRLPFFRLWPMEDGNGTAARYPSPTPPFEAKVLAVGRKGKSNGHDASGGSSALYSPGSLSAGPLTASATGRHAILQTRESTDQKHPVRLYH